MQILDKLPDEKGFPLIWANLDYFPDSKASYKEIYLNTTKNAISELAIMFYDLFDEYKNSIYI